MRKKVIWVLVIGLFLTIAYLASLSDQPIDDSYKFVDIDSYISQKEMSTDIDSIKTTFEKIHPNPYRFTDEAQLVSELDSIKGSLPDSLTIINFWRVINQVLSRYNDAHSYADDSYVLTDYVSKNRLFFPLSARLDDEKLMVSKNDSFEQLLPEGTEIIKINGKVYKELKEDLLKHSFKETRQLRLQEISDDFSFSLWKSYDWNSEFQIHYKKNDSESLDSITVQGMNWEQKKKRSFNQSEHLSFKLLNDHTGYMRVPDFNGAESEIIEFYEKSFKLLEEKKSTDLILDFRGHNGGADSYGEHLAKHFAQQPFKKLSKANWKITPEFKEAFDRKFVPKSIRWFKPIYLVNEYSSIFYGAEPNELVTVNYEMKNPLSEEKRFLGNVYLITDHNTFSAGSIFAEMFKYYNMGRIIGQPTGNLYSFNGFAMADFTLPNSKLSYQVSSVYNVANSEEEGMKSVEPDIIIDIEKDPLKYIIDNLLDDKKVN
jgi:hypothetical protein